ncbi:hypothetical protein FBU30_005839 [Linnemannia zychae]|nr:hypothetical protein FBU30_005839 [Linnemannia zychae]
MFIWLAILAVLTLLSQFLLEPTSFPTYAFDASLPIPPHLNDPQFVLYLISPTHTPLSGYTAIVRVSSINGVSYNGTNKIVAPNLAQVQACVLFAHLEEILWLGACVSLLQWTWYLYRSLKRKLGVVSPRLMEAVAEYDSASRGIRTYAGVESDMSAGFSFTRTIRSLADICTMLPTFIILPIVIVGVILKTCILRTCCFCLTSSDTASISDQSRDAMEEEIQRKMAVNDADDIFEAWPKWPNYLDDPLASTRTHVESSENLPEIQAQVKAPPHAHSSISTPTSMTFVSEHPSLATKLGVSRLDLNDTHEEIYGYDITKKRIRYHRNSWSHRFRVLLVVHHQLIHDTFICVVIPLLVFMVQYFVPTEDRAYDVYPNRGGCRVSILSIFQFKRQHGALSFKMKSLTPSPAVLRLYKSTNIVKNILLLCVSMNTLLTLGLIVHLGFGDFKYNPSSRATQSGFQPLFRVGSHDHDVFLIILAILLVTVTFVSIYWASLKRWLSQFYCFQNIVVEEDEVDSTFDNNRGQTDSPYLTSYSLKPLNIKKEPQKHPSINSTRIQGCSRQNMPQASTSNGSYPVESETEMVEKYSGSRLGIVDPSMVISVGSERQVRDMNDDLEERFSYSTEVDREQPQCCYHAPLDDTTLATGTGMHIAGHILVDSCNDTSHKTNAIKPELPLLPPVLKGSISSKSLSSSCSSSSWLTSAPVNADGVLTAILNTSNISNLPIASNITAIPLTSPKQTLSPKLSKSDWIIRVASPEPAYTQGPLPTIPDKLPLTTDIKTQQQSDILIRSELVNPPPLQLTTADTAITMTKMSFRDSCHTASLSAVGQNHEYIRALSESGKESSATRPGSSDPFKIYPSVGLLALQEQQRKRQQSPVIHTSSLASVGASPLLPGCSTHRGVGSARCSTTAAVAALMKESGIDISNCHFSDDSDDDCDLETMGAISLEGLVLDEPIVEYDSIHQTMMLPHDNRTMLENIVHHALMTNTFILPPTTSSSRINNNTFGSSNKRSPSRGRRRPSVIQYSNSPYGCISRTPSGRNRKSKDNQRSVSHQVPGAYFHLVSKGLNVVDLYGDYEDDDSAIIGVAEAEPQHFLHRKKSSRTLFYVPYPHIDQHHQYHHPYFKNYVGKNKHSHNVAQTPRPDSPTDPVDPK